MALVVMALRPPTIERPPVAPFEIGAVAASGDTVWRWVGPTNCNADADVVQLERSVDGGPWVTSAIPLSNIYGLSFADDQHGVATGTTATCTRGVAVTSNGGRTWRAWKDNPVLLDAWYTGSTIWGVERVIGTPQLGAYHVDPRLRVRPDSSVTPSRPCSASDGVPDQVAFWSSDRGLLLCQNTVISSLLVARTANAARSFEALADDRPQFGLDGSEGITELDVAGSDQAWALFEPGGACGEGQLRESDSQGATFTRLPCASKSIDVDEVLDVSFTSDTDGVLLGLLDRAPVMATTSDGGKTWTTRS
jgi:hypothetical protein